MVLTLQNLFTRSPSLSPSSEQAHARFDSVQYFDSPYSLNYPLVTMLFSLPTALISHSVSPTCTLTFGVDVCIRVLGMR